MLKRPLALLLLFTSVPQLGGCAIHQTVGVRPADLTPEERGSPGEARLVRVAFRDGQRLAVDTEPPAFQSNDTIYAWAAGAEHRIPRSSVDWLVLARANQDTVAQHTSDLAKATQATLGSQIIAVTRWVGPEVRFDRGRPVWLAGDTLRGTVGGSPYAISGDSIRAVSVNRGNPAVNTSLPNMLVIGVLLALVIEFARKYSGEWL